MLAFKALVCVLLLSAAAQAHSLKRREAAQGAVKSEVVEVGGPGQPSDPLPNHAVKAEHPMLHIDPAVREPVLNAEPAQPPVVPPAMPSAISQIINKLPPFVQSVFKDTEKRFEEADAKFNDMLSKQKNKPFFSILLLKKNNNNNGAVEGEQQPMPMSPVGHQSIILFKISPKKEGEVNAPFGNLHLLGGGGADDVDNKFFEFQKAQREKAAGNLGADDLDKMHAQMTGVGEDVNGPAPAAEPLPLIPQIPFFDFWKQNGKRPYLIPKDELPKSDNDDDDDDSSVDDDERNDEQRGGEHVWVPPMIIRRKEHDGVSSSEAVKKCMMQHFLRLKASLYYRTVLHMLFISGVLLFTILMFMLSMRICRRRLALNRMHGMMSVSAIDTKLAMANAPPAYEQLVSEKKPLPDDQSAVKNKPQSALVNSLAQAYRNRYSVLVNAQPVPVVDADAVSVSSLPNYEEHTAKVASAKSVSNV